MQISQRSVIKGSNLNLKISELKQPVPLPELPASLDLRKSGLNFIQQGERNMQLMVAG